jgi:hypothetical protein
MEDIMSTDISTVEEVAFGAARTAAEVASDPIGSARKQVKGLKRKGTPTARKVNRQVTEQINSAIAPAMDVAVAVKDFGKRAEKIAAGLRPERIAMRGLHAVKVQAKRQDQVGEVAKRTLKIFNGSLKTIARVAGRLEKASELPVAAPRKAAAPRRAARRTTARRSAAA